MKPSRLINLLIAILIVVVSFAIPDAVTATQSSLQTTGEITGEGQICNSRAECGQFSITFDPAGGPVTGSVYVNWPITRMDTGKKVGEEILQGTLTGTFDGEDGGAVRGTMATGQVTITYSVPCETETCINETTSVVGTTWEGNLRADGTGNGRIGPVDILWNVTYSAEDFQAGLGGKKHPTKTPTTATQTPGTLQPILEGKTIHATGQVCNDQNSCGVIELTFNTAGGPVTGSFSGTFIYTWSSGSATIVTTTEESGALSGIFSGGDGGTLSGTASTQVSGSAIYDGWDQEDYQGTNPIDGTFPVGPFNELREWNGVLNANGTGNGYVPCSGNCGVVDGYFAYTLTFSAADFPTGLAGPTQAVESPTPISQDYIQQQIGGISVEMGDKPWSEDELQSLNEVISNLPPSMRDQVGLLHIVRYTSAWDIKTGKLKPNVRGDYSAWDQRDCPTCARSANTIRIFDNATNPVQFANDTTGDIQFKATILHEITHALQSYKNGQDIYTTPSDNPIVQDFIIDSTTPGIRDGWGWDATKRKWIFYQPPGSTSKPPTDYGYTNPMEDLSESVKMYVYNPQLLQNSSPQRYNYIRDKIYRGIEYDNGKPKGK